MISYCNVIVLESGSGFKFRQEVHQFNGLIGFCHKLRSHIPHGQKTKTRKKKEQYCNKFNKDFKTGLHKKQTNKQTKHTIKLE